MTWHIVLATARKDKLVAWLCFLSYYTWLLRHTCASYLFDSNPSAETSACCEKSNLEAISKCCVVASTKKTCKRSPTNEVSSKSIETEAEPLMSTSRRRVEPDPKHNHKTEQKEDEPNQVDAVSGSQSKSKYVSSLCLYYPSLCFLTRHLFSLCIDAGRSLTIEVLWLP